MRLPPKGGINAPPETERFLISTASPTGSRAVFQYASDARPPKVLRTSRGYYFNNSAKGAHSARRLSRDWRGEGARQNRSAIQGSQGGCRRKATELPKCNPWLSPPLAGCPHPSRCSAARSTAPPSPRGRRCAPAARAEFALCGGRERRFALNMPRSAEKARSFAEKFFILRDFGRRRLDYYGEQRYN